MAVLGFTGLGSLGLFRKISRCVLPLGKDISANRPADAHQLMTRTIKKTAAVSDFLHPTVKYSRNLSQTVAFTVDTRVRSRISVQPQSLRSILSPANLHLMSLAGHELVYSVLSQMTVTITDCVNLCRGK